MQRYDITSKVLFKDYTRDFVGLTIKDKEFEIIGEIDTELPIVQMRMIDAPVRVKIGEEEAIVHTEFQTETSKVPMELRLAEYVGRLLREHAIPVYVTVIYLGESAGVNDPGGYHYALDDAFSYSLRYQVIRFPEMDGQDILDKKEPVGLLPFSTLMKMPEGVTKEEWLRRCTQTVLSIKMDVERKQEYVASFFVLSSLMHEQEFIMVLLKEERVMIEIEKSSLIKMFTQKAREEGIAEGIEEGIEKGITKGYMDALVKIVKTEYGKKGVRELEEPIRAIQDEQKLFALIEPALTSPSLEAFKKVFAEI